MPAFAIFGRRGVGFAVLCEEGALCRGLVILIALACLAREGCRAGLAVGGPVLTYKVHVPDSDGYVQRAKVAGRAPRVNVVFASTVDRCWISR